jgi:hypothetical protein
MFSLLCEIRRAEALGSHFKPACSGYVFISSFSSAGLPARFG